MAQYITGGGRAELVSTNERLFILQGIVGGYRIDGRGLLDYRSLKISFGKEYGMVQVQLGQTRVFVVGSCEVAEPSSERPTDGYFDVNVSFSPMAAPEFDGGRPTVFGVELSRVIERSLKESRAIDTEALCIVAGSKVWSIHLDIYIIDNVGNLIDCCSIGAITALHHMRRPDITIQEHKVIIHTKEEKEPVPLSIHHIPICVTFGIFLSDVDAILVVDPQWKEEVVMKGRMTTVLNVHKELCTFHKAGGVPLDHYQILGAVKIAILKVENITAVIKEALKKDLSSRLKDKVSETTNLMTLGIGAELKNENSVKVTFYNGTTALAIEDGSIKKHVPDGLFSNEDVEKDFEEFTAQYLKQATIQEQDELLN